MKFRLMSDLHLEFQVRVTDYTPMPLESDAETVLILAGDVATGKDAEAFISKMCEQFYKVVYVLGNHEFYHNEYNKIREFWQNVTAPENLIVLDDAVATIDGKVRLVGGTLWTDFNNSDWFAMQKAKEAMNDFHCIKIKDTPETAGRYQKRTLHPSDTVRIHNVTKTLISETVRTPFNGPTVVVTHHLPHPLSVDPRYATNSLNPAYMTNLDNLIADNEIAVWCHGHTHHNVDVVIHGTRILCNPRGYVGHELNQGYDETFIFEV